MASLMLVNPRKRRSHKKATATHRKIRRNPAKAHKTRKVRRYARNPIGLHGSRRTHKRRKYHRNPIGGKMKGIFAPVVPAAISAVGAIGLDLGWSTIKEHLPESLKKGPAMYISKALGALAIGTLAGMVTKKETAALLSTGALTVVFHDAMKNQLSEMKKSDGTPLFSLDGNNSMDGLAEYLPQSVDGMGEYVPSMNGLGYEGAGVSFDDGDEMAGFGSMGEGNYSPFTL